MYRVLIETDTQSDKSKFFIYQFQTKTIICEDLKNKGTCVWDCDLMNVTVGLQFL